MPRSTSRCRVPLRGFGGCCPRIRRGAWESANLAASAMDRTVSPRKSATICKCFTIRSGMSSYYRFNCSTLTLPNCNLQLHEGWSSETIDGCLRYLQCATQMLGAAMHRAASNSFLVERGNALLNCLQRFGIRLIRFISAECCKAARRHSCRMHAARRSRW